MSNTVKGYLVGIAFSLGGVALWIILGAFVGIVAGWAAALMGILFFVGYNKYNKEDKSKVPFFVGSAVIIVEVFLAEMIVLGIIAQENAMTISELFAIKEIASGFAVDLIFGFVFGLGIFISYAISTRKKQGGLQSRAVDTTKHDAIMDMTATEVDEKEEDNKAE
ncbi:hypothetical protein LJC17_04085 [Acholeplasma sp. OttesenSCG-928-E16]|nr:hypothetical protein [Acholeplasma sp. OttesenSCG-928-E16]